MALYQKEGPIAIIKNTVKERGITGLYSGCTALVIGNSAKAGVRFLTYDYFKHKLSDSQVRGACLNEVEILMTIAQGKVSAPRSLLGRSARSTLCFASNSRRIRFQPV